MRCFFFDTRSITHKVYVESFNAYTFERHCCVIFATFDKIKTYQLVQLHA